LSAILIGATWHWAVQPFVRLFRRSGPLTEEACRRLTLAATVLGSSMASVTAITVALPEIRSDFGIGFGAQQWIMLSYSLALASLYLVAGLSAIGSEGGRCLSPAPPVLR
jgi:hypothetical protein